MLSKEDEFDLLSDDEPPNQSNSHGYSNSMVDTGCNQKLSVTQQIDVGENNPLLQSQPAPLHSLEPS